MSRRVWALRRSQPVPVAGTLFSLTAHAAVVLTVAVGDGGAAGHPESASPERPRYGAAGGGRERLYWVGVGGEVERTAAPARDDARPPVAYVVPGRGGLRVVRSPAVARRDRAPGGDREARAAAPPARAQRPTPAPEGPRPAPGRRRLALPDVVLPESDAMLLIAGVVSAAPDLVRRVSSPDDFARAVEDHPAAVMDTRAMVRATGQLAPLATHALPVPLVSNPAPVYPAALVRAGVGGQVVVEFTIDSTGVVDVATLRVVRSTDPLFTEAVRGILPQLRFAPAQRGARAVGVTVRQPFLFTLRTPG